jgi:Domain of unknown function (DUF222)
MLVVRGRLEPEVGAMLVRALEAAREALYARQRAVARMPGEVTPPGEAPLPIQTAPTGMAVPASETEPPGQQQADALALVAETALAHGLDPAPGQERYQVVVHVDAAVLADPSRPGQAVLEDGVSVPAETSRRLACEAAGPPGSTTWRCSAAGTTGRSTRRATGLCVKPTGRSASARRRGGPSPRRRHRRPCPPTPPGRSSRRTGRRAW